MTCVCPGTVVSDGCMFDGLEFKAELGGCLCLLGYFRVSVFCQCSICWG